MTAYLEQIRGALDATRIHSPTLFSWFGMPSPRLPQRIQRLLSPETAEGFLSFTLQSQLYANFYTVGCATPASEHQEPDALASRTELALRLSDVNCGTGFWDEGWVVRALDGPVLVAGRDIDVRFSRQDVRVEGDVAAGSAAAVRFPKEFFGLSPGFYMAVGDRDVSRDAAAPILRLYWNLVPDGALILMERATCLLNAKEVGFRLKVLNDPLRFTRCDAAVLYLSAADLFNNVRLFKDLYVHVAPFLMPATPAFTLPLADGLALAEDPELGESFGMNRCKTLAKAIVAAHKAGTKTQNARLEFIERCFAQEGVALDMPYVNGRPAGAYEVLLETTRGPVLGASDHSLATPAGDVDAYLRAAYAIGEQIVQEAIWSHDRCTWLGSAPAESHERRDLFEFGTLGPDLYGGSSGVALFLAELFGVAPSESFRRTALGGMEQALYQTAARDDTGLYTGTTGVAFAAARVGKLLGSYEMLHAAETLVRRTLRDPGAPGDFDLLSGKGGRILGLLALSELLDDDSLIDTAGVLGKTLVEEAEPSGSWRPHLASRGERPLTGLSHGASGAALALLELFRITGKATYGDAAGRAFAYERCWFDSRAENWPDFRKKPGERSRSKRSPSFAVYWCHGAPGIALARLRAYQILRDEIYRSEAVAALRTTAASVRSALPLGREGFSLCHGLAGNAEVLLHGHEILEAAAPHEDLPRLVAEKGLSAHLDSGRPWRLGAPGRTPSLMLGLGGIGYFYLRLCRPAIPSMLTMTPEHFRSGQPGSTAQKADATGAAGGKAQSRASS